MAASSSSSAIRRASAAGTSSSLVRADLGKKIGVVLRLSHYSRLIRSGRKIGAKKGILHPFAVNTK
jgi:hypothetical protein